MQHLLIVFIAICMVACLFYFRLRPNARKTWILGVFLSAIAAVSAPAVLNAIGNTMGTIALYVVLGVVILGITVAVSLREPKVRQEPPVMIRYHFREMADMEAQAGATGAIPVMLPLEMTQKIPVLASDVQIMEPEGIRLTKLSGRGKRKKEQVQEPVELLQEAAPYTGSKSLMRQRWGVIAGGKLQVANISQMDEDHRPMTISPVALDFVQDAPVEVIDAPDNSALESIQAEIVEQMPQEVQPAARHYATLSFTSQRRAIHGQYPWSQEAPHPLLAGEMQESREEDIVPAQSRVRRVLPASHPRPRRMTMYDMDDLDETEESVTIVPKQPEQQAVVQIVDTVDKEPIVFQIPQAKLAPAPSAVEKMAEEHTGNEDLLDLAFDLKWNEEWVAAAAAFRDYAQSAQAPWAKKQADVEQLSCLVSAGENQAAADLVFAILGSEYSLSSSERDQIIEVMHRLQQ